MLILSILYNWMVQLELRQSQNGLDLKENDCEQAGQGWAQLLKGRATIFMPVHVTSPAYPVVGERCMRARTRKRWHRSSCHVKHSQLATTDQPCCRNRTNEGKQLSSLNMSWRRLNDTYETANIVLFGTPHSINVNSVFKKYVSSPNGSNVWCRMSFCIVFALACLTVEERVSVESRR